MAGLIHMSLDELENMSKMERETYRYYVTTFRQNGLITADIITAMFAGAPGELILQSTARMLQKAAVARLVLKQQHIIALVM